MLVVRRAKPGRWSSIAQVVAVGLTALLVGCSEPPSTRDIVIVNLDRDVRIVHVAASQSELGWFRIEGETQATLVGLPTRTGLDIAAFGVDCQVLSTTGYPTGSEHDHRVVIDQGQLVLEDAPRPQPPRDLVRVEPCES